MFVDLGGADGMIHLSELSYQRVKHPSEVVREGDHVQVKVISVDRDTGRIGLSLKALQTDPWAELDKRYPPWPAGGSRNHQVASQARRVCALEGRRGD